MPHPATATSSGSRCDRLTPYLGACPRKRGRVVRPSAAHTPAPRWRSFAGTQDQGVPWARAAARRRASGWRPLLGCGGVATDTVARGQSTLRCGGAIATMRLQRPWSCHAPCCSSKSSARALLWACRLPWSTRAFWHEVHPPTVGTECARRCGGVRSFGAVSWHRIVMMPSSSVGWRRAACTHVLLFHCGQRKLISVPVSLHTVSHPTTTLVAYPHTRCRVYYYMACTCLCPGCVRPSNLCGSTAPMEQKQLQVC